MYVHSLPLEANLYFQFNLPDGCKISTQQLYLYYASCSNTQDWSSTPFSHMGILIPKEWLLMYYIFIWLSLLSVLILVLHKKSLRRILQTPHHYRFQVTSRTHPSSEALILTINLAKNKHLISNWSAYSIICS